MRYTFGDNNLAARRLQDIAGFFNPHSAAWIRSVHPEPFGLAIDLGCGPGFSTEMLRDSVSAKSAIGLEQSTSFIALAESAFPRCRFVNHNVTQFPLPATAANVIYSRNLLAHLPDVEAVVNEWVKHLVPQGSPVPGGVLLLEEPEVIETEVPVFRRYLDMTSAMVRSQGADMMIGAKLTSLTYNACVCVNETYSIGVPNGRAAAWFSMNARAAWDTNPYLLANYPREERDEVVAGLECISRFDDDRSDITWTLRRMGLRSHNARDPHFSFD